MPAAIAERLSRVAIGTTAALLLLLLAWQLSTGASAWRWLLTALLAVPAAAVLMSLLRHRPQPRAWTILGAIPYLTLGLVELIANPAERGWATGCTLLGFVLFMFLAWLLRMQRAR